MPMSTKKQEFLDGSLMLVRKEIIKNRDSALEK